MARLDRLSPTVIAEIINEVAKNPLIYDYTLVDYKDMQQKNLVWRQIANKVGVKSGELVAWKWKHLRDSYAKYKKHLIYPPIDKNGQKTGLVRWRWAPMMTFLDPYMRKPRGPDDYLKNDSQNDTTLASQTESSEEIDSKTTKSFRDSPDFLVEANSSQYSPMSNINKNDSENASSSNKKRKFMETISEVAIEPFLPEKHTLDMTDYFFLSYAETFKRLHRKTQAKLKLKMAKMFTEAELEDLENDPINCKVTADDSD